MKKGLLVFAFGLISFFSNGQIATYAFGSLTGFTTSVPSTTSANSIAATALVRGSGLTAASASAGFNSSAWTLNPTRDATDYLEVTFTNNRTSDINLTGISSGFQKSNATSSPQTVEVTTIIGGSEVLRGTQSIASGTTGTLSLAFTVNVPVGTTVTVRIYAFGGTNAASTLRLTGTLSLSGNDPLPVTYTSIQARSLENNIELAWGTSSEVGAEKFEIERSNNALEFYKIGQVTAQGESRSKLNYSFIDNSPIEGINYYRLKQIDLDGKYEYSKIVSATFGKEAEALEILGNPTQSNKITLLLKNLPIEQLKLFSTTGQNIPFDSSENDNRLTIQPKSNLSSGIYYLVLRNTTQQYFRRLVIE
jgi:hypothetical protein